MKRLDKGARSEMTSAKGMQEREIGNIQRKDKRISPQKSKRGSPHHRGSPSGWGKGLDHDSTTSRNIHQKVFVAAIQVTFVVPCAYLTGQGGSVMTGHSWS